MNKNLAEKIADSLRAQLPSTPGVKLAAISVLARHYGVSLMTMLKAVRLLRNEGLLDFSRGRKIRTSNTILNDTLPKSSLSQMEQIADEISSRIFDGTYKSGAPLPKIVFLAARAGVSQHSIRRALNLLQKRNVVWRNGRTYLAGPKPVLNISVRPLQAPVILVLVDSEEAWRNLFTAVSTRRFMHSFSEEAIRCGVQLMPVLTSRKEGVDIAHIYPSGEFELTTTIRELGKRYLGTLIVNIAGGFEAVQRWAESFQRRDKYILWYDRYEENFDTTHCSSCLIRCCPNIKEAAYVLLSLMKTAGHKNIGIPCFLFGSQWTKKLIDALQQGAVRLGAGAPNIIVEYEQKPLFEHRSDGKTPIEILTHLKKNGIPFLRNFIDRLFLKNPSIIQNAQLHSSRPQLYFPHVIAETDISIIWSTRMIVGLLKKEVTAIVAPDEYLAAVLFNWFRAAGIKVPQDISLICLETIYETDPLRETVPIEGYPISSIDAGVRSLGYQAFHILRGDIKISCPPPLVAPLYVERGSVGPPRTKSLGLDLNGEVE